MLSNDCKFVIRVINSCKTMPQLKVADKLTTNFQMSDECSIEECLKLQRVFKYKYKQL